MVKSIDVRMFFDAFDIKNISKLILCCYADDFTKKFEQRLPIDMYFKDNSQHFDNYWDGRSFRLSATYSFGAGKKSISKKKIKFEEKDRAQ